MRYLISTLLFTVLFSHDTLTEFEGSITYRYSKFDGGGMKAYFPQEMETLHVSSAKMLVQIISGPVKDVLGYDLLLDVETQRRYEVYRDRRKLVVLPYERLESLNIASNDRHEKATVLGFDCLIKTWKQFSTASNDTIEYTYYLNDFFSKSNLQEFAILQANKNTLFLDGRFNSIPLKVEMLYKKSNEHIVIEAVNVKKELPADLFSFEDYEIQDEN